jgi:hypothetical protein
MVRMAAVPLCSTLTRRSMLLTLPLVLRAGDPIRLHLFLATECPISNRYVPELNRIANLYQPRGVQITAHFPEAGLTQQALDRWTKEFKAAFPAALDANARQARKLGAKITPEAVIQLGDRLLYRGRIDDRYVSWGKSRPEPQQYDVVETLDQLLEGKIPPPRLTKAWGCVIE